MQYTIQKFRQSSIVFEKRGILSENLKNVDVLQLSYSSISFLKLRTRFYLPMSTKGVWVFFYFI